ncbi:hypothetical protein FNV64_35185 [Streptomyces sp. S1A1-7]|uniref:hypothetical protein n=1 Tax=Streptomyces sp. S1A1-7 TaxID=2594459 RepID=UPI001161DF27|nr:hypothetical protein [Streptomyces sp. S1A1-7]QDN80112.1 hypothetical protein FNV64_35185 [Streptomyces sp. S1A1-7]
MSDSLPGDQAVRLDLPDLLADIRRRRGAYGLDGTNLIWEALALRLVLPAVDASRFRSLNADEDAAAVTGLFNLLGQFRESRTSSDQTGTYSSTRIAPAREVTND